MRGCLFADRVHFEVPASPRLKIHGYEGRDPPQENAARGSKNGWGRGSNFGGPTPQGPFQLARVPFNPDRPTGWKPPPLGQNGAAALGRNRRGVAVDPLCSYNIYSAYPTTPRYPAVPRG